MGVLLDQPQRQGSVNPTPHSHQRNQTSGRHDQPAADVVKQPWYRIQTRYRWGWCFLCIMIWGSILSLDRLVTYSFQTLAANSFQKHSSLTFISVVRSVIAALAGPPFAILEQLAGSQIAWLVALACYVAGHGATAGSTSVATYTAGITFYELGANGCVILQQILVARVTSSRDRQLFLILPQLSFLVWAFISSSIFSALSTHWRWGIALFSILGPIALLPLVGLLHYTPSPTRETGTLSDADPIPSDKVLTKGRQWSSTFKTTCSKADVIGLALLGSGTAGVLVPLILAGPALAWAKPRCLAPLLVSGVLILPTFLVWQLKYAPYPLIPRSLFRSRTFIFGSMAEILFQASFAGAAAYLPTYLYVVMGTSADAQQNVSSVFSFSYALGCLPIALVVRYARKVKYFVVFGAVLFTIGAGVMILRGPNDTPSLFRIVVSQVLMGFGASASMAVIPSMVQIDAQRRWAGSPNKTVGGASWEDQSGSSVDAQVTRDESDDAITVVATLRADTQPRGTYTRSPGPLNLLDSDVGKAIAALNICQSIGAAIGNALSGTLWSTFVPRYLNEELAAIGVADQVGAVFSAPLTWIVDYPIGTEERDAVIKGYNKVWRLIMILFTALLACSVLVALLMENLRLDDGIGQSAEAAEGKTGLKDSNGPAQSVAGDQELGSGREEGFVSDLLGQTFFLRVEAWFCRNFPRRSSSSGSAKMVAPRFVRRITASPEPEATHVQGVPDALQRSIAQDRERETGSHLQERRPSKQDGADAVQV
ncbi:MFS general substrate transporter [Microstroma glucosiphilum]|uniref:MFS general substrate transporter n=1 Tax=Pseudomicrostroma glucosiphilum TaxID=1684307 RepID=A0A316U3T3_9BASI|nr:MFS general substrate transporter [Pseudomicrostroma glucosiphilum]PWN19023.1 MFS general substrate transporter [Pseudomicrostroma glucosiphilum]